MAHAQKLIRWRSQWKIYNKVMTKDLIALQMPC